jgi:gamma-glutamyltranspeptidase/glutathione hydrolase
MVSTIDLTSASWQPGERDAYLTAQSAVRGRAGTATGRNGAVTVAYGAYAARAGLAALKQGGTSVVHQDAKTGAVHTMNAEWNTVAAETDPRSIPGKRGGPVHR